MESCDSERDGRGCFSHAFDQAEARNAHSWGAVELGRGGGSANVTNNISRSRRTAVPFDNCFGLADRNDRTGDRPAAPAGET